MDNYKLFSSSHSNILALLIFLQEEITYPGIRERDHNFSMQTDAEVLQWNQFTNSEVGPFINGLLSNLGQNRTRWVLNYGCNHQLSGDNRKIRCLNRNIFETIS